MADSLPGSAASSKSDSSPSSSVELRYPTINLRTSYESLLSNSTVSANTTPTMTRSHATMDESWTALRPSDYSNDEDQQSDIVDTGSLVDLSSTHDTESVLGDETPSEPDLDEEAEDVSLSPRPLTHEDARTNQAEAQEDHSGEDIIILQKSDLQPCGGVVAVEYTLHSTEDSQFDHSSRRLKEQIVMTVSASLLDTAGKPFHIAYFGPEVSGMRDELLGKIGAAIVLPLSSGRTVDDSTSSLYNIVPTEFGPGSKPTFADLLPLHAQMAVEDIKFISDSPDHLRIISKKGVLFDSVNGQSSSWRPDLIVVHVDRYITQEDKYFIDKVTQFTEINAWPSLVVTRDVSGISCTQSHGSISRLHEAEDHDHVTTLHQAIDLETFIMIDTEQINRHLKFLAERSALHRSENGRFSSLRRLWKSVHDIQPNGLSTRPIQLKPSENMASDQHTDEVKPSILSRIKDSWDLLLGRQTLKDTLLSLAVLVLGLYIMRFSQGLAQSAVANLQSNTSTTVHVSPSIVPSVGTSVPVAPEIPPEVHSVDQDIMVHEPISFDQVWSRLTGKVQDADEKKGAEVIQDKQAMPSTEMPVVDDKMTLEPQRELSSGLAKLLNSSRNALGHFMDRLDATVVRLEAAKHLKQRQQAQIEEMNQKILDFWAEVPQSLRMASKHSHERYEELVRKSQKHMRRARWATDKRMEELIKEQKKLLSRAQHQAQLLTGDMPRRKRCGVFGRGCTGGMKHGRFWR